MVPIVIGGILIMSALTINVFIIAISCSLLACSHHDTAQDNSLYQDIGGQEGIDNLVNIFVRKISQNESILPYFAKSSVTHFKTGFSIHLCNAIGGPCDYQGDTMVDIHTGMNINEKDFNRVVELLISAMEDADISYPAQNRILNKLAPSRSEIINL